MKEIIIAGILDKQGYELVNRVYSPKGICPTINTMGGGGREPKFLVEVENEKDNSSNERQEP